MSTDYDDRNMLSVSTQHIWQQRSINGWLEVYSLKNMNNYVSVHKLCVLALAVSSLQNPFPSPHLPQRIFLTLCRREELNNFGTHRSL